MKLVLGIVAGLCALVVAGCGDDGGGDDDVQTTTTAGSAAGDDEGVAGPLCDVITDDVASDALGVEVSSAETEFNDENTCNYESADRDYSLFLGRTSDVGQSTEFFLETGVANVGDFEELEGIGDAAYFGQSGGDALAAAIGDGLVYTANLDFSSGEEISSYRDALVDLLTQLVEAT